MIAALALAAAIAAAPPAQRIIIASDSTAANYGADRYPQMGWGMVLKCSLDPSVEVVNLARGGRSTKTFIEEGLWDQLLAQLKPGDTVLIQFGHNDADTKKIVRFTDPNGAYDVNLRRFVADVRAAKGTPVLVTPIARWMWENGQPKDAHGPYAATIHRVATDLKVPLVDLDGDMMAALKARGELASRGLYLQYKPYDHIARYPEGVSDDTHINEQGARLGAALVATRLAALKLPISRSVHPASVAAQAKLGGPTCP
ncbi:MULTISPECIES: rhamnogalacturonan acetylesterase [unclassified Caulobacter]|uniref:rhamnogalacturonan acetylesterase n=1 Tax=unclassified Caulobacter TaxID=2648921 RepID=UPI0006FA6FE9|nr:MULTISPECIES: rhamnogalacturonan acetylesterase [unclassified Caulobacter]KQV57788.1 G-D-S-L family lipolytic protein [Caulobacter sp. Root342]KQV67360.1 G-D-S-L family lipolytic protein [Caulobacter sp. Root343]